MPAIPDPSTTYVTVDELKDPLTITDTSRDDLLIRAVAAASRLIDRRTGRRFYLDATAVARIVPVVNNVVVDRDGTARLLVPDIGSTTGLVVETGSNTAGWSTVSTYDTLPDNAIADGRPVTELALPSGGTWGWHRVRITAQWGWPAVPDEIAQACLLLAIRLFKRKDSPEGVMGNADWGVMRVSRFDPDVEALISPYTLPAMA